MKELEELCRLLCLPEEVQAQVLAFSREFDFSKVSDTLEKLFDPDTWETGLRELKGILGEDERGIGMLSCMLFCALKTHRRYQELGIGENIFIDTMKAFTRFVKEHRVSYGCYGFDREWWTVRQLSLKLFRIGELEYECSKSSPVSLGASAGEGGASPCIYLHIPSDARLLSPLLAASYRDAKQFFARFFPEYSSVELYCESWLLSPALKEALPESSNILKFQKAFLLQSIHPESDSYLEWVFKRRNRPVNEELPEDTSLQKNLKRYVLSGGKVGEGIGMLRPEGFL